MQRCGAAARRTARAPTLALALALALALCAPWGASAASAARRGTPYWEDPNFELELGLGAQFSAGAARQAAQPAAPSALPRFRERLGAEAEEAEARPRRPGTPLFRELPAEERAREPQPPANADSYGAATTGHETFFQPNKPNAMPIIDFSDEDMREVFVRDAQQAPPRFRELRPEERRPDGPFAEAVPPAGRPSPLPSRAPTATRSFSLERGRFESPRFEEVVDQMKEIMEAPNSAPYVHNSRQVAHSVVDAPQQAPPMDPPPVPKLLTTPPVALSARVADERLNAGPPIPVPSPILTPIDQKPTAVGASLQPAARFRQVLPQPVPAAAPRMRFRMELAEDEEEAAQARARAEAAARAEDEARQRGPPTPLSAPVPLAEQGARAPAGPQLTVIPAPRVLRGSFDVNNPRFRFD